MSVSSPINRWPFIAGVVLVIAVLLYALHPILSPFAVGALLAYLGDPIVDRLEARGVSRTGGVALVFLVFTLLGLLALAIAVPVLLNQADEAIRRLPGALRWLSQEAIPWLHDRLSLSPIKLPMIDWESELAAHWKSLGKVTADTLGRLTRSGMGIAAFLLNLSLVPVVAFYLMRDWDRMVEGVLDLIPRAWQENISLMVSEANDVLGAFIRGQMLVMLAQAVMYSLGLWLVGLDFALILGVTAGLAAIIPYAGAVIGIGSSLAVAYFQFGGEFLPLVYVGIVFAIGQTVESLLLTPILIGDRIGLHPVMVIFALMAGGQLAGFTGVLVALPVAAVMFVFFRHAIGYYRRSQTYQSE